jgi:endonuclease/exonuclease/phosphatase family metal-dependent hydrolase
MHFRNKEEILRFLSGPLHEQLGAVRAWSHLAVRLRHFVLTPRPPCSHAGVVVVARFLSLLLLALLATPAAADDVPVDGASLVLRAHAKKSSGRAWVALRDAAIRAPSGNLGSDGATLVIDAGQCQLDAHLPARYWSPLGRGRAHRGFRYHDRSGRAAGIRTVLLRQGSILIVANGKRFPCTLGAPQSEPVRVELEAGDTRWCAAFGGRVVANESGRFVARRAPAPDACGGGGTRVTAASLNILHGFACPGPTDFCRFDDRLELLFRWIEHEGCPDVVTLQEVSLLQAPTIEAGLATLCGGAYQAVYVGDNFFDDEMHLVRHPVLAAEEVSLYKAFRTVLFTRTDHPVGPLDVFSTHLASGSDSATAPCGGDCPPECVAAHAATVRDCQAVQLALFVESRHDVPGPAFVTGDFNEVPGSFVYEQFAGRGWLDAYLEAGLPECDPATGEGCTSGREDSNLSEMESPESHQTRRIDFLFVVPEESGSCELDPEVTRIFTDDPNPFAPSCGAVPSAICWPSDHEGMQVGLECR